jgi:hypothetical protein
MTPGQVAITARARARNVGAGSRRTNDPRGRCLGDTQEKGNEARGFENRMDEPAGRLGVPVPENVGAEWFAGVATRGRNGATGEC